MKINSLKCSKKGRKWAKKATGWKCEVKPKKSIQRERERKQFWVWNSIENGATEYVHWHGHSTISPLIGIERGKTDRRKFYTVDLSPRNSINIAVVRPSAAASVAVVVAAVVAVVPASFIELKMQYNENLNYPCPNYATNGLFPERNSPKCNERKAQDSCYSCLYVHNRVHHSYSPFVLCTKQSSGYVESMTYTRPVHVWYT